MSIGVSETDACIEVLAYTHGLSAEQVTGHLADYFKTLSGDELSEVAVNRPCSVTVNKGGGKYGKKSLIGEEKLNVISAYRGKRDTTIVQAGASVGGKWVVFEFHAKDAEEWLDGYTDLVHNFAGSFGLDSDISDAQEAKREGERIEKEAYERSLIESRMNDDRFGSW